MSQGSSREHWFSAPAGRGPSVLVVTERVLPEPDPDEGLLMEALAAAGLRPRLAAWDDPAVDWASASLAVIRSTWNYHHHHDAFNAWAARVAGLTHLWNPAPVVQWNSDKSYLTLLAAEDVPVIPTAHLFRGSKATLQAVVEETGWRRLVIKPAVSASSYRTMFVTDANLGEGIRHFDDLLAAGDVLVQPYLTSVEGYGERAVVWIDGEFTHAVRKLPRFAQDEESVSDAVPIAGDEMEVARAALALVKGQLLYARVDVARDARGNPMVMELELIEPSLFLLQSSPALERLVNGIRSRISGA